MPLAVSRTSTPFCPLAAATFPSGITPPNWVFADVPSMSTPSRALPTAVWLLYPRPKKLAWIVVLSESLTRMPLPPLPLTTFA